MPRIIKDECLGAGSVTLSIAQRESGFVRCGSCGRYFKLRRGAAGLVVDRPEHSIPRHSRAAVRVAS